MAPITPPERSGEGRAAIGDRLSLIRASPPSPSLVTFKEVVVERRPDEATAEDFLDNPRRRVGKIHDPSEQLAGSPAASNCPSVTIYAHAAADPLHLATQRRSRSGTSIQQGSQISRFWRIELSARGFSEAGVDAGLRFLDLRRENGPSFQRFDELGGTAGSKEWQDLAKRRNRDCAVGAIVNNEVDGGMVLLLNHHAVSQLWEEDFVLITPDETVHDRWEIPRSVRIRDRIRHQGHVMRGMAAEIDVASDRIVKVVAAGGAIGVALHFLGLI